MRSLHTKLLAAAAIVFAACLALLATSPAAGQSSTPTVAFDPPSSTAVVGASVAVDLTVANVPAPMELGGYSVWIRFDPAVVRIDAVADSGFITSGQLQVACGGEIDNIAGTGHEICTPLQFFGAQGVSASSPVPLVHVSFTALAPGTSPLSLAGSTLSDPTGAMMAATFGSGSIVVEAPTPMPSASPRTTATPGSETVTPPSPTETTLAIQPIASAPPPPGGTSIAADTAPSRGAQLVAPAAGTGPPDGRSHGFRAIAIASMVAALALLVSGGAIRLRSQSER